MPATIEQKISVSAYLDNHDNTFLGRTRFATNEDISDYLHGDMRIRVDENQNFLDQKLFVLDEEGFVVFKTKN